jgi:hypothetical protein
VTRVRGGVERRKRDANDRDDDQARERDDPGRPVHEQDTRQRGREQQEHDRHAGDGGPAAAHAQP